MNDWKLAIATAAHTSIFPQVRMNYTQVWDFLTLVEKWRVPLEYQYSVHLINGHYYECDSVVDTGHWRAPFVEWEYSEVDCATLTTLIESSVENYLYPGLMLMSRPSASCLKIDVPVCDLQTPDVLQSLKSKYRYMVKSALRPDVEYIVTTELTDEQILWAMRNISERFSKNDLVHALCLFLWSVARRNTFVIAQTSKGLQGIAGFQEQGLIARFASFASDCHAVPNVGLLCLWHAVAHYKERGFHTLEPTAQVTVADEDDPNYVFKRRITNSVHPLYAMGSTDAAGIAQGFRPPYYHRELRHWVLQ